ncbi:MAG: Vi polysaccharide biosynthesis protein VipB/TviC [Bacteroidetes bacterium RIFCSPLOWO2_02_FULL_36_8]|nr:MAG: Vi polysaccharide biosynthesis protein VipB/TviC [Bacteroidetes bacterium RIFCSPLOWO2_02_FULL_36_8]OFY72004.1 MAG: Vi polysaccharide biosynthesis protein VipB/TviC [Bacteroidetes bacterium RIFCSPLOWO2_12_FULL_37_12]
MYKVKFHIKDLSNYNFLITGGAGFIGSHIVDYLISHKAGKIRVLDNLSNGKLENLKDFEGLSSLEFVEGDIRDLETCKQACRDIHYICHLAAVGSIPRSVNDPVTTNNVNINGFLNLLIAAKEAGIKRLVYSSSSSVYGDNKNFSKSESELGNPLSPYAVTKQAGELYAKVFSKLYNFEIIGLRYFNVFGPRQDPNGPYAAAIPIFINCIKNNQKPVIYGDGNQTRDFTYVENVVQANMLALFSDNKEAINEIFNVGVGERTSVNVLYKTLCEILGKNVEPSYVPPRAGDIKDSLADISKIIQYLEYNPRVRLRKGLEMMLGR